MKEETGLDIQNPRSCGIKQFPIENGRYIVFLFHTEEFLGEVTSSDEGEMVWVKKSELPKMNTINDLPPLLQVMEDDNLTEFQYVIENHFICPLFVDFLKAFQSVYQFPYVLCYNALCDFVSLIFSLVRVHSKI